MVLLEALKSLKGDDIQSIDVEKEVKAISVTSIAKSIFHPPKISLCKHSLFPREQIVIFTLQAWLWTRTTQNRRNTAKCNMSIA